LPAAQTCPEIQIVALADINLERARALANRFGVLEVTADYHTLFGKVDGAINALPHHLHAPVTMEFLRAGIPVLLEKPFAPTVAEAEQMIQTANATETALQIGHMYRFCVGAQIVKQAVTEGWLGALQSFSLESGFVNDWPVASGFFFDKKQAGGGVLLDTGSHMLDLLLWWLGDAVEVEYRDDSLGGVEADCWLSLTLHHANARVPGIVTLSKLRNLKSIARIVGERFAIEYDLSSPDQVRFIPYVWEGTGKFFISDFTARRQTWNDVYADQLRAFAKAIISGGPTTVPGESVIDSIALIERCYQMRQPLEVPWMQPALARESVAG